MRWADTEAVGLFEEIKNGRNVTDNYGRLIWNYENRGNSWRNLEMVGLLTKIRDGVDIVDNYGRMIWNYANRGNGAASLAIYYVLIAIRDTGAYETLGLETEDGDFLLTEAGDILEYG